MACELEIAGVIRNPSNLTEVTRSKRSVRTGECYLVPGVQAVNFEYERAEILGQGERSVDRSIEILIAELEDRKDALHPADGGRHPRSTGSGRPSSDRSE